VPDEEDGSPGGPTATDHEGPADLGSVADEAAKLLESLRRVDWAAAVGAGPEAPHGAPAGGEGPARADRPAGAEDPAGAPAATPGPPHHVPMGTAESCTYCPVCRAVTVLRAVSPETLERLADLAGTAAALLSDLAAARTGPRSHPTPGAADGTGSAAHTGTPRTHRVPVVDEEE
jgi:hypothetical protein